MELPQIPLYRRPSLPVS